MYALDHPHLIRLYGVVLAQPLKMVRKRSDRLALGGCYHVDWGGWFGVDGMVSFV